MTKERIIALIIAAVDLMLAFLSKKPRAMFVLPYLILPLGLIWMAQSLGNYVGPAFGSFLKITEKTPEFLLKFIGWLLLIAPIVLFLILKFSFR